MSFPCQTVNTADGWNRSYETLCCENHCVVINIYPVSNSALLLLIQLWRSAVGAADRRGAIQRDRRAGRCLRSCRQQAHAAHPFHVPRTLRSAHGRWDMCGTGTERTLALELLRCESHLAWGEIVVPGRSFHFPKAGLEGKCFMLASLCNKPRPFMSFLCSSFQ